MGLFSRLNKSQPSPFAAALDPELFQVTYDIAYFLLPKVVFENFDELTTALNTPALAAEWLYTMACRSRDVPPLAEHLPLFHWHRGQLADGANYIVLEYPPPPQFDMASSTLAPYFTAIVTDASSGEIGYFNLGQAPISGTTLRMVTRDGMNSNLGPGPTPELSAFLAAVTDYRAKHAAER